MKTISLLVLVLLIAANAGAQQFEPARLAGKGNGVFFGVPFGVAREVAGTTQDLATSRDRQWQFLTIAQIGAATADVQTTMYNFHRCPSCEEIGDSRFIVGRRPDLHKYVVFGVIEIAIEVVAAHYLRRHGPTEKWYWRPVWMLPQTISLYGHLQSTFRNISPIARCDQYGQNCF
jgi:hypothetical protein